METLSKADYDDSESEFQSSLDDCGDDFCEEDFCGVEDLESYEDDPIEIVNLSIPDKIMKKYDFIQELPEGICVMGGVARSIARELLTGEIEPIRDIDLVAINDFADGELNDDVIDEYSKKYMLDDYNYGHGIGFENLDNYFNTRDFTVNQVLIHKGELLISEQAIDDFEENIIRPTKFEKPYEDWYLKSKLAVKGLLMKVVLDDISESVSTLEDFNINAYRMSPFFVALGLNKAFDRGKETARNFTNLLVEYEILKVGFYNMPEEAAKSLRTETDFVFRPSSAEAVAAKGLSRVIFNRSMNDLDYYSGVTNGYRSNNKAVMSAIDDYADFDEFGDAYNDRYSSAVYDRINKL